MVSMYQLNTDNESIWSRMALDRVGPGGNIAILLVTNPVLSYAEMNTI